MLDMQLPSIVATRPNLQLKTWPKQLLGTLPLDIALHTLQSSDQQMTCAVKRHIGQMSGGQMSCGHLVPRRIFLNNVTNTAHIYKTV